MSLDTLTILGSLDAEITSEDFLANFPSSELVAYLEGPQELPVPVEYPVKREPEYANYPGQDAQHVQQIHHLQPPAPNPQNPPNQQSEEQLNIKMPSQILATDYAGDAGFEVYISPHHGKRSPWMYSSALGKIFISMNQVFPVDFKCKFPSDGRQLHIRATPVFSDAQHKNQLVTRCINHVHDREKTNEGINENIREHIIRCHDRNAKYGGSKLEHQHLYVRVPLNPPGPGSDSRQLQYLFMCKNSCTSESGMNRRAIEVVFTLEDDNHQILGRRVLKVRICSCPKRDKENEEKAYYQKGQAQGQGDQPQGKKRKLEKKQLSSQEMTDSRVHKLEINVPGNALARAVLKAVHGVLASEMVLNKGGDQTALKKSMEEIQQKLNAPLE